jgi:beta-galactosidase
MNYSYPIRRVQSIVCSLVLCSFVSLGADREAPGPVPAAENNGQLRERTPINSGWRFTKGDPAGVDSRLLLYDVRPEGRGVAFIERPAEFTEAAEKIGPASHPVLKPYILPTGNRFLKDAQRRSVRPEGSPGADVPYTQPAFDDSSWRQVDLPHDWAIEGPFASGGNGGMGRLPSAGIGWYRRKLDIPAADAGRSVFLEVEGAMSYAEVWVNGKLAGGWPYGYASWSLDITPYLTPGGSNQLAIRLDNPPNFSRWYPGAGLYRNVWLVETQPVHVAAWGSFIATSKVSAASATVDLELTVENDSRSSADVSASTDIYALDAAGTRGAKPVASLSPVHASIAAGSTGSLRATAVLDKPRLWGPPPQQQPNRYVAMTTIFEKGKPVDRYETVFGVRSVEFKSDGVYVNGERIRINGVNNHHDLGALGAAFNRRAAERQLEMLREMGCNSIRTSHNPPAPELLELTDRMGFLVMDEIFDAWQRQKTPFDFHLIFDDWHEQDLRAFIRRDRNSPSVILWSVGNEVGEQDTAERGAELARKLVAIAHEEDPTRPATASMNSAKPDSPFAAATDVIALNYQGEGVRDKPPQYPAFHEKFPSRTILGSEAAAALSSRGEYLFPVTGESSARVRDGSGGDSKRRQVSAYELCAADFGSSADKVFATLERHPYVAGQFVWSGWDYLGEPSPYSASRSSYYGIIDLAGFKKDRFFLYQSVWRPDLPMAHILPHWTWPDRAGQVTPVHVFTSGDEAELFLNGKSLGRKKKPDFEYRLRWDNVLYEPGGLKVIAYKNGKQWATDQVRTAEAPASLSISADSTAIRNDGLDLSFVTVTVTDRQGVPVPQSDRRVRFSIEGPAEIVATDNGDSTSFEPFPSHERAAFNGRVLAIVRAVKGKAGAVKLTAESPGLQSAVLNLRTVAGAGH